MKTIAILSGRYLPGYKDGGPVRTLINLSECLGKEYRFKIITNDRDHGDECAYPGIKYDAPNVIGNAEVWYLQPGGFTFAKILELTKEVDMIYVCGPYDDYAYKTMILKRAGKIKQPLVIASMGSFSEGAYGLKKGKKELFISICKALGLFKNISWSVTSEFETEDVRRIIGRNAICTVAEDLPRAVPDIELLPKDRTLKVIFLSRICKKKNLSGAIEILNSVKANVQFDIYGTLEEEEYWQECKNALQDLPENVFWKYRGTADSERVIELFSEYDIFLFPTLGENYGHVIFEALAGGAIPVISDQTPWMDLEENNCGKVLALENKAHFSNTIDFLDSMPAVQLLQMRKAAREYAKQKYNSSVVNTGYRKIFG